MTDNLIIYELQRIHEALTKSKEEHTLNFRMIKPTEKFSEPMLNTTKLGLISLSVYNSVFNINILYHFLYASTVLGADDASAEYFSSITNGETWAKPHTNTNTNSNFTSVLNYNYKGIHCYFQLLHQVHMN